MIAAVGEGRAVALWEALAGVRDLPAVGYEEEVAVHAEAARVRSVRARDLDSCFMRIASRLRVATGRLTASR